MWHCRSFHWGTNKSLSNFFYFIYFFSHVSSQPRGHATFWHWLSQTNHIKSTVLLGKLCSVNHLCLFMYSPQVICVHSVHVLSDMVNMVSSRGKGSLCVLIHIQKQIKKFYTLSITKNSMLRSRKCHQWMLSRLWSIFCVCYAKMGLSSVFIFTISEWVILGVMGSDCFMTPIAFSVITTSFE